MKMGSLDKKFTGDGLHFDGKGYEVSVDRLLVRQQLKVGSPK